MKQWRGEVKRSTKLCRCCTNGQDYRFIVNVEDNRSNWLINPKVKYLGIIEIFSLPLLCHLIFILFGSSQSKSKRISLCQYCVVKQKQIALPVQKLGQDWRKICIADWTIVIGFRDFLFYTCHGFAGKVNKTTQTF